MFFLGQPSSEYNFLSTPPNELNTPPVSMDWEPRPEMHATTTGIDDTRADPMLFSEFFTTNELDSLPTPDLMMAPNDAASLFGNMQVVQDIADAQTTKESKHLVTFYL